MADDMASPSFQEEIRALERVGDESLMFTPVGMPFLLYSFEISPYLYVLTAP